MQKKKQQKQTSNEKTQVLPAAFVRACLASLRVQPCVVHTATLIKIKRESLSSNHDLTSKTNLRNLANTQSSQTMSNKYKVLFSHWRGKKRTQAFNLHPQYYGPRLHITCLILVNTRIIKAQLHFLFQDSTSQFSWLPDLSRRNATTSQAFSGDL